MRPRAAWRAGLVGVSGPVVATAVTVVHFFLPVHLAYEFAAFPAFAAVFGYLGCGSCG